MLISKNLSTIKTFENQNKISCDEATDFYDKETPKVDSNYNYLAVISLDSALKKDKNYYRQMFFKECKYIEKKVIKHISDNFSDFYSSDDFDEK